MTKQQSRGGNIPLRGPVATSLATVSLPLDRVRRDGFEAVAELDLPAGENVGAQASAVHERAQDGTTGIALEHRARLAQSHSPTAGGADGELAAYERVQVDPADDEVAAVLVGGERRIERLAHLGLDQRQRASRKPGGEGPTTAHVTVAVEASAGEPARLLEEARALASRGLEGDRHVTGRGTFPSGPPGSALTMIEAEVCESFDPPLEPSQHRRNVVTRGIDLNALVGREFTIGEVRCRGMRLCEPCTVVQRYVGRPVLRALVHRGGLRADILADGSVRVGDPVRVAAPPPGMDAGRHGPMDTGSAGPN